ncbi:MAG TPA: histidine kinase [Nocardioides bacterium]|nr:histidine kinase [Nocardioides sp.]
MPVPAPRTERRWAVLVLPVVSVALFAATVWLDVHTPAEGPGVELAEGSGWPYAAIGMVFGVCCAVVLLHDRRQAFGWGLGWIALFWGTDGLAQSYVRFAVRADEALPGVNLALWMLNRFGAFLPLTVAALLLIFPTGRFLEGRWGAAGRVAVGGMSLSALLVVVAPANGRMPDVQLPPGVDLDVGAVPMPTPLTDILMPVAVVATIFGVLVAMASVVVRYRRSTGLERDRMRWLLWAVVVMAVVLGLSSFSELTAVRDAAIFVVAALPAVAMTIGIVRPTLVPVQQLLDGTYVFALLSVVLVVVDLAVVAVLHELVGDRLGQRQVVLVVLLLSAVLYNPLRAALWSFVRRLFLGQRDDPYDVVARLASSLEAADEEAEQLTAVAQAVALAFGIGFVSVEVDRADGDRIVASYGTPVAETRSLPITYRGEQVGMLVLPARGVRARLSGRDERLLSDLVRQAATASRTGRLADELQQHRQALVVAREEERRRIHHDLTEDLGPTLGGLVHQVESARLLVKERPEAAKETIARTSERLRDVVADVRRVVHDLRPPALDDLGLVGALRQQAALLDAGRTARLHVDVRGDAGAGLPAGVEVAAFRIASELLERCAALDSRGDLVLDVTESALVVGLVGTDADPEVFLDEVRDRATEIGGRCGVTEHGAVRIALPMRRSG